MRLILIAVLVVATVACDESTTGPSSSTRVEALIQDSSTSGSTGSIAGNISASIWNGDRWVDLGSPNGITVPLQVAGRTTTIHGEQSVPPGSYSRARLTFQGVIARLTRGSIIDGVPLTGDANTTLGGADQRVEVTAPISVSIDPNARDAHVVTFDLRSQNWLSRTALDTGRVEDSVLQATITASTRVNRR